MTNPYTKKYSPGTKPRVEFAVDAAVAGEGKKKPPVKKKPNSKTQTTKTKQYTTDTSKTGKGDSLQEAIRKRDAKLKKTKGVKKK